MAEILYLERYDDRVDRFVQHLADNGLEAEVCKGNRSKKEEAIDVYKRDYEGKEGEYRILLAHLGIDFNRTVPGLLEKNPGLRVVYLIPTETNNTKREGRKEYFYYYEPALLEYIQDALKKEEAAR